MQTNCGTMPGTICYTRYQLYQMLSCFVSIGHFCIVMPLKKWVSSQLRAHILLCICILCICSPLWPASSTPQSQTACSNAIFGSKYCNQGSFFLLFSMFSRVKQVSCYINSLIFLKEVSNHGQCHLPFSVQLVCCTSNSAISTNI